VSVSEHQSLRPRCGSRRSVAAAALRVPPSPGRAHLALAAALLAIVLLPARAAATIQPASVLDGPSNAIVEVAGAAMAPDGSGGIVYCKEVAGITHVFAVPFANGRWGAPVEVDGEDPYGASEPAIAAGEGGRLLVVWVQPRNVNPKGVTLYELMSASLQPGSGTFGQPIIVDPNIGEPYTGSTAGVDPHLAMAPDGAAYIVYRAVTNECKPSAEGDPVNSACPPSGTPGELVEVRVARFQYLLWSSLGAVNRAPQVAMPPPDAENAPAIGIALNGEGVVAWQEPESNGGPARIWVRRLFGTVQGNVLQASPETLGGRLVTSNAEAPALAVSAFGEARIAYRIAGAPGSAVTTATLFLNSLSSAVDPHGAELNGSIQIAGTTQADLGVPAAAIDPKGAFRLAWTQGGGVQELAGSNQGLGAPTAAGPAAGQALTTINPAGGGTTAWTSTAGGLPVVDVHESYAGGAFQTASLAGNTPGAIGGLALGGSGAGDALLGWTEGPIGQAEVVGDFVQAPPTDFLLDTPNGWVRSRTASISWEAATDAVAGVTYTVYVDGHPRLRGLTGLSAKLSTLALGDGIHHVQVLAIDSAGQQTMSARSELKIDAQPPIVRVRLIDRGRGVRVTVRDDASGVDVGATHVAFGDGGSVAGRKTMTHLYRQAGDYTIVAQVRDRVGNHAIVHLRVRVR
jgi:hypothetical protein